MVFQSYAVFPHMKVYDNIAFGLRMQKEKKAIDRRARALVRRAPAHRGLPRPLLVAALGRAAPARRRCARDRDEGRRPADGRAALQPRRAAPPGDARRAEDAAAEASDATTIYVTHDQIEALSMGDRIAVMNKGRIVQLGNPLEVYDNPRGHVRRRLHRHAADELPRGRGVEQRRRRRSSRSAAGSFELPGEQSPALAGARAPARHPRRGDRSGDRRRRRARSGEGDRARAARLAQPR